MGNPSPALRSALLPVLAVLAALATGLLALTACQNRRPSPEGTLHLFQRFKIGGFDPAHADDYRALEIDRIYDPLLAYHYLKRPLELTPRIVERMPEAAKDGLSYSFQLKKGVYFHDDPCFADGKGRELGTDDVLYSIRRIADPRTTSPGWALLSGKIAGLDEWRARQAALPQSDYRTSIAGLVKIDDRRFRIRLTRPSRQLLLALASSMLSVVPREAVETYGKDFGFHPVGTGPYRLVRYVPDSKIFYKRHPRYRPDFYPTEGAPGDRENGLLADAGKPVPFANDLEVRIFSDAQPLWLAFLAGELDYALLAKGVLQGLSQEERDKYRLVHSPSLDTLYIGFNMQDPWLGKNRDLRAALSLAIDPAEFVRLFVDERSTVANGPVPPGLDGYRPDLRNPLRGKDLPEARRLLRAAGFPEGKGLPTLRFMTYEGTLQRTVAEYVSSQLAAIGVRLEIDTYAWPRFLERIKARSGQLWGLGYGGDMPDAQVFFSYFYGKNQSPGPNDTNYASERYDRLYERWIASADGPAKAGLQARMERTLLEDCPAIWLAHRAHSHLLQPRLRNFKFSPLGMSDGAKYLRVER